MADQFIFAVPYSSSALGTVAMLGRRWIIQRRADGKELKTAIIPHWAGQATLIGGSANVEIPVYDAIAEMFAAQTGLDLPVSKEEAEFTIIRSVGGGTVYVLPIEVSEGELTSMIHNVNSAIEDLSVPDGVLQETFAVSTLALDEVLHRTAEPEGGWERFMYRFYFDYIPGALDRLPPVILTRLRTRTQEDPGIFRLALATLPESPVTVTLTGITVVGAVLNPETDTYVVRFQTEDLVQLQAQTSSNDPLAAQLVAWEVDGEEAGTGPRLTLTPDQLTARGAPIVVMARLGSSEQRVTLAVRPDFVRFWIEGAQDVQSLDDDHRLVASATYGLAAPPVEVRMTLSPDTPEAYDFVTWTGGTAPGRGNDRRLVSRAEVTRAGQPVRVTASLNPEFEADVAVLPVLQHVLADGVQVAPDGNVRVVYTGDPLHRVTLRAVTDPDSADAWTNLVWVGGDAGLSDNIRTVSLNGVQPGDAPISVTVRVGAGPVTTINISVVPELIAIDPIGFATATGARTAQAFRGDGPPVIVQLRTNPADAVNHPGIVWSGNALPWRSAATRAVNRDLLADQVVQVTATLGGQQAQLDVSMETLVPFAALNLAISRITFNNTLPLNDDDEVAINQIWRAGQPSPVEAFVRGTTINLTADFTLAARPGANRQVDLRGTAWVPLVGGGVTLTRWSANAVNVPAAGPTPGVVTLGPVNASAALANEVSYQARANAGAALAQQRWPLQILWEARLTGAGAWQQIGWTEHPTNVTLAAPAVGCEDFWTSFDISCRNADGATTVPQAIAGCYAAFEARDPATGANIQMRRTSDNRDLTYWLTDNPAQHLAAMLASFLGDGSCLAFSELALDMFRSHGIATPDIAEVVVNTALAPVARQFAVATWAFNPPTNPANFAAWNYTRAAGGGLNTADWAQGPGQNQPLPPPLFINHFIIENAGDYYDPSYGTLVQNSFEDWSRLSIAGLERLALPDIGYAGPPPMGTAVTEEN